MPLICGGHLAFVLCLSHWKHIILHSYSSYYQTDLIGRNLYFMVYQNLSLCVILSVALVLLLKAKRVSLLFSSYSSMWSLFGCVLVVNTVLPFLSPLSPSLFFRVSVLSALLWSSLIDIPKFLSSSSAFGTHCTSHCVACTLMNTAFA